MRIRSTWTLPLDSTATSDTIYRLDGSVYSKRSNPIVWMSRMPSFEDTFEASSDVSDKSTFHKWNSFEHYSRKCLPFWYSSITVPSYKYVAGSAYDRFQSFNCPSWMWKDSVYGPLSNPTSGLPALYSVQSDGHFVWPAGMNVADLEAKALQLLLPQIRPQMSLLNSVYELKDFKRLPDTLRRIWSLKSHITEIAQKAGMVGKEIYTRWLKRKTLRRALNSSADGYLTSEFAILPLLRDISGFQKALAGVEAQVKKFLALEQKNLYRHYNADIGPSNGLRNLDETSAWYTATNLSWPPSASVSSNGGSTWMSPYLCASSRMYRRTTYTRCQFHAEIHYSYWLSSFQRESAMVKGLMDALGVNLNPAIIWNAIPWSFVVDWVIGIGQWLDQFKTQNLEPITLIHRWLWSVNVRREITVGLTHNGNSPYFSPYSNDVMRVYENGYRRNVGNPPLTSAVQATGLSLKEFALAGSILLSKRTRRS